MLNLTLITVGTLKEGYLRDAAAEYEKRLQAYCKPQTIVLKESKLPDAPGAGEIAAALHTEGKQILAAMPPKAEPVYQPQSQQRAQAPADDFDLDAILDGGENLPALNNTQEVASDFQPQFIDESDITPPKVPLTEQFMVDNMFTKKALFFGALFAFILGFAIAKFFFAQETVVRDGLQGVVINPEVPRGRARCGVAERTQGCVLYIMNPQRQELTARDFYDLASQLTGRQRFVIETGNMRYSNVKIRPGGIAQLNIPPLQ